MKHLVISAVLLVMLISGIQVFTLEQARRESEHPGPPGEDVYIAEGCINCHSQYSRPNPVDMELWGPPTPAPSAGSGPVLVGNRRQGPDLSNIGFRRSREWNRIHLISPQTLVPGSRMPGYRHLFEKGNSARGNALLDYLESLQTPAPEEWISQINEWEPALALSSGNPVEGQQAYMARCSQCHGEDGVGSGPASQFFGSKPRNLVEDNFLYAPENMGIEKQSRRLAQIFKYGQPGTSMPGHETMSDKEIIDLLAYLLKIRETKQ